MTERQKQWRNDNREKLNKYHREWIAKYKEQNGHCYNTKLNRDKRERNQDEQRTATTEN